LKAALVIALSASAFAQSRTVVVDDLPYAGDAKGTPAEAGNANVGRV